MRKSLVVADGIIVPHIPRCGSDDFRTVRVIADKVQVSTPILETVWECVRRYASWDLDLFMVNPPSKNALNKTKKVITAYNEIQNL